MIYLIKEFKITVLKMLTELRRTMHEHSEKFNKEIENTGMYHTEVTEPKNTITELKNIKGFNRFDEVVERISELKDRVVEGIPPEQQAEKMKKSEDNIRELWDNIKWSTIYIIGVPEGEEKKKGAENTFEETVAKNCLCLRRKQIPRFRKPREFQVR